jgi:hypothetical protein
MESKRSKSDKKSGKELSSFKNRLGPNLIWFNSLSVEKQYDLLFMWKKEKWRNSNGLRPKLIVKYNHITRKREKSINPPLKLKHWIISWRYLRQFATTKGKIRNSTINIILNEK